MDLEQLLNSALERIRSGSLENEAQVKQAVILPILRALGWDDSDPAQFKPEYAVDQGRVDYALLAESGGPLVFIEAKGIGRVDIAGEEQVFRYAVNKGCSVSLSCRTAICGTSISAWRRATLPSGGSIGRN